MDYKELPSYDDRSVHRWADFCSSCFRDEGDIGHRHFLDNYYNDPNPEFSKIFIGIERNSNVLGGAVRVLRRKIWLGSRHIDVIGLADICTDKRCRREGLGTRLVNFVLNWYRELGESTFLLHADEQHHTFYARNGFHMLRSQWSLVSPYIKQEEVDHFCRGYRSKIMLLDINREDIALSAAKFAAMSESASVELCLLGSIEKNPHYFKDWVAKSHLLDPMEEGVFRCIIDKKFVYDGDVIDNQKYLRGCLAYVCFVPSPKNPTQYKICDVGFTLSHAHLFAEYFMYLMVEFSIELKSKGCDVHQLKFEVPSALGIYLSSSGMFVSHVTKADNNWMICTDDIEVRDSFDCEYSCWPIDYF